MVTEADEGFTLWVTDEYVVTSGWEANARHDKVVRATWSELDTGTRSALIEATMRAHGYELRRGCRGSEYGRVWA